VQLELGEDCRRRGTGRLRMTRTAAVQKGGRASARLRRALTREIMSRLQRDAAHLAGHFELSYRVVEPEGPRVKSRYGVCFSDGTIRIRLFHATTGKPLRYSSLVDTLCHELAHLRHFNHSPRFYRLYRRLLEHARRAGIYRPRPVAGQLAARGAWAVLPAPVRPPTQQLLLF